MHSCPKARDGGASGKVRQRRSAGRGRPDAWPEWPIPAGEWRGAARRTAGGHVWKFAVASQAIGGAYAASDQWVADSFAAGNGVAASAPRDGRTKAAAPVARAGPGPAAPRAL